MAFEPKNHNNKYQSPVYVEFTEEENNRLTRECEKVRMNPSDFIRFCVGEYFKTPVGLIKLLNDPNIEIDAS